MAVDPLPTPNVTPANWGQQLNNAITTRYTDSLAETAAVEAAAAPRLSGVAQSIPLWMYGNSYAAYTINSALTYFDRLIQKLETPQGQHGNWGVASTLAADQCSFMYGTWSANIQFANQWAQTQSLLAGTWSQNANASLGTNGVVILESVRNDAGLDGVTTNSGTTAKSRAGFSNALDAMIRLMRAKSRTENNNVAWTYSANWTHSTGFTGCSGGNISFTTTNARTATITIGGDCDLILLAVDDAALGATGSTFTVGIDGTPYASGTTSNQTRKTQFTVGTQGSTGGNYGFSQMAVPIRGLAPGSYTLVLTHTGSAGHVLYLDCLLSPRDNTAYPPPTIIVPKNPEFGVAGYATYNAITDNSGASRATDVIYNGLIDSVLANFDPDEVLSWDPMEHGFDNTTMIGNKDAASVHLNDVGTEFYANGLFDFINTLPARDGLVRL